MATTNTVIFTQNTDMLQWGTVEFRCYFDNSNKDAIVASVCKAFKSRFNFLARVEAKEGPYMWLMLKGKSQGKSCVVELYSSGVCIAKNLPGWNGELPVEA